MILDNSVKHDVINNLKLPKLAINNGFKFLEITHYLKDLTPFEEFFFPPLCLYANAFCSWLSMKRFHSECAHKTGCHYKETTTKYGGEMNCPHSFEKKD